MAESVIIKRVRYHLVGSNWCKVYVAILSSIHFSCSKAEPPLSEPVRAAIFAAAHEYYRIAPIGAGWRESNYSIVGNSLHIKFLIPQASAIMKNASEFQHRAVGVACPSTIEPIWKQPSLGDIVVEGATPSGDVFIDVSCKRWGM